MSETISVLGIDPSLRNSGFALVSYNTETEKWTTGPCGVLSNPQKYTGTTAIKNILEMIQDLKESNIFGKFNDCVIESPPVMFNPKFPASALLPIAHVAGACAVIFGINNVELIYPSQWNKGKNKAKTHAETAKILGDHMTWNFFGKVPDGKLEHVLDAASIAFWYIKFKYLEETNDAPGPKRTKRQIN